jgi:hypothetical protein
MAVAEDTRAPAFIEPSDFTFVMNRHDYTPFAHLDRRSAGEMARTTILTNR